MKHETPANPVGRIIEVACLALLVGTAAGLAQPVAVSPGDAHHASVIADRCPTFNWGAVEGVQVYELKVFRLPGEGENGAAPPETVVQVTIPGSAHGWTPSLERCLEPGGRYAWSLRARIGEELGEWSEASFFRVAALPSVAEVEQALVILREFLAAGGELSEPLLSPAESGSRQLHPSRSEGPPSGLKAALMPPDAVAVIGESPDTVGVTFGLHGISKSADDGAAGVMGQSTSGSGEVFGVAGQVESTAGVAGVFDNTAGGDVLRGQVGGTEVFRVDGSGRVSASEFSGDGSALTHVNAVSSDGLNCAGCVSESELDFDPATQGELEGQTHSGEDITSGTVAEGFIDTAISRDDEILPTVLAGDGAGSLLDADLLDGNDSSAFLPSGTDDWIDETGDTMTGTLILDPASGPALQTSADVVLEGDVLRGGSRFLHADGNDNTSLGDEALLSNTVGSSNTAVGGEALKQSLDGNSNTAVGYTALSGNTSGSRNTGLGVATLSASTTGTDNVAVGHQALSQNTTGSGNVAIGSYAGTAVSAGNDNVFIAHQGEAGDTGTVRIGDPASHSRTFIAGISNSSLSGSPVVVDASGRLGIASGGGDSDTLDGLDSTDFLRSNTNSSFTAGTFMTAAGTTLAVDGALALPSAGISGAGGGSGLDADLLDGNDSSAFMPATTDNWVNQTGDTMTGTLSLEPAVGNALETTGDIDVGGSIRKGGILFIHNNGGSTAVGSQALLNNTTGVGNTAVGGSALSSNTIGIYNTAAGTNSMFYNESGVRNTSMGARSLLKNVGGSSNATLGYSALYSNTTGSRNVAIGYRAGYNATTGDNNVFIANEGVAGEAGTIRIGGQGTQNRVFIAGISNNTLSGTLVVVDAAGQLGVSSGGAGGGDADTLDGLDSSELLRSNASDSLTAGTLTAGAGTTIDVDGALDTSGATSLSFPSTGITGAGSGSGLDSDLLDGNDSSAFMPAATDNWVNQSGDTMTGTLTLQPVSGDALVTTAGIDLGGNVSKSGVLFLHDTGSRNTGLGNQALSNLTFGASNTAVGYRASALNSSGSHSTAVGARALENSSGSRNTALGSSALQNTTSNGDNTAIGYRAMLNNTIGGSNTASGSGALQGNTTGSFNTAVGFRALLNNTSGRRNTAIGIRALYSNSTGIVNTASGAYALRNNDTGSWNTAAGYKALYSNTTGGRNTAVGYEALPENTTGSSNVALGKNALQNNTTGSGNIAVGYRAGFHANGDDNIHIGHLGQPTDVGTIRIGTPLTHTKTYVAGVLGSPVSGAVVYISGDRLGVNISSKRYKEDIRDMAEDSSRLLSLRPVAFRYRQEAVSGEPRQSYGLIAEEVAEVMPELVVFDEMGRPKTVLYHLLSSMLLNELQKQALALEEQSRQLGLQARELERLSSRLDALSGEGMIHRPHKR